MAIYTIESNGQQFDIEGPDNATQDELQGAVDAHLGTAAPAAKPTMVEKAFGLPHVAQRNPAEALGAFNAEMGRTGEQVTEALGKRGVPAPISAAAGMVPTFAPDIIAGMVGGPGGKVVSRGTKLGRMLTAPGVGTAGKELGAALEKEGVALTSELLETPTTAKGIKEFSQSLFPLKGKSGEAVAAVMEPAELNRKRAIASEILDNLRVKDPLGRSLKDKVGKTTIANLSQIKEALVGGLKVAKPDLVAPFEAFAGSKGRQAVLRTLGKAAKTVGAVTGGTALGYGALRGLFK